MKLGQILSRLGFVDSLFNDPDFDRLWQMAYSTDKRFWLFNGHVREFDALLPAMLGLGPSVPWHPRFGPPFWAGWHASPGAIEPLDDLPLFPIPSVAAKHVTLNPASARSPQRVLRGSHRARGRTSLATEGDHDRSVCSAVQHADCVGRADFTGPNRRNSHR